MKLTTLVLSATLLSAAPLLAQGPDQGGPGAQGRPPMQGGPQQGGPQGRGMMPNGGARPGGMEMGRRGGGMERGMWWKDADTAKAIELTADQTKRIDDIFMKSRINLIHMHASLEEAELMLEPLMNANPLDNARTAAAIDKVADTRAGLEKANAHMLLDIRSVLTAQQWTKLQDMRGHRGGMMRRGAGAPGQPGQPGGPNPGQ